MTRRGPWMEPAARDSCSPELGEDDRQIATVDADGMALAAIQALYKLSLEKDMRIEQLEHEVSALRARLEQLANR